MAKEENIINLRQAVEKTYGKKIDSPKEFKQLSESIYIRTRALISTSTLMRIWGYVDNQVQPRSNTLNALAKFVGFRDWEDFINSNHENRQSNVVISKHLNVSNDLRRGDKIRLRWLPDRVCDIEYLGNLHFKVLDSVNTALKKDATFICPQIIEGEPLYLDKLEQYDIPGSVYVCGKLNGIRYNFIVEEDDLS